MIYKAESLFEPSTSGFKGASSLELPSKEPLRCRMAGERGMGGRAGLGREQSVCP